MTTTTAQHLRTIALTWIDLRDALGTPNKVAAFGVGLRGYLAELDRLDAEEVEAAGHRARALRLLERDPSQLGERPVPIRLAVYDTMRTVEAALVELADQTAAVIQYATVTPMPARHGGWTTTRARDVAAQDKIRRDRMAAADAINPQRWKFTGRRTAPLAALWLCARIEGVRGPQRPLDDEQRARIGAVARTAGERVERALDTGDEVAAINRPCPCGGRIEVHGGAGKVPVAHCGDCGTIWTEQGAIKAA